MSIVLITAPAHSMARVLAQKLADKTGWPQYSRDRLAEEAHAQGIKLSRLEASIIKAPIVSEKLAWEKEIYLSFVTDVLYKKIQDQNLIYTGRAAHLLFPGVKNILRVGVSVPMEIRADIVAKQLNLNPGKALDYLKSLDVDIMKWVHYVHRADLRDTSNYDLQLNLENLSLANAADVLMQLAELPEFHLSDESVSHLEDLHLAARATLHLALNKETSNLNLGVRASGKVVTVTYLPRQKEVAESVSRVLGTLEECKGNVCTMAETNILYLSEHFDPKTEDFNQINQLAKRWGAAIELIRLIPPKDGKPFFQEVAGPEPRPEHGAYTGGVEDDGPEVSADDGGLDNTIEELVAMGRSAGGVTIAGGQHEVIDALRDNDNYSLVVLGDLFLSKGPQASTRLTRELGLAIHERMKTPVIKIDELKSQFLFGMKQAFKLLMFCLIALCIYGLVFSFQVPILNFLGGSLHEHWKWAASVAVVLFVPFVAYIYGTISGLILKLVNID
ncbi:MAG: cytidylate kinase-like family protein [Proteobacteria bacterium]|nr:cytidylate kinase-like family protein [Pseudomonadota bacterium]MBU4381505.1 cytidylate kinase-like family protein [Pseudomonadota bacterium]MCG2766492.1 cytidylate kinase-like family protein [Desulfarculaceae bacterium]